MLAEQMNRLFTYLQSTYLICYGLVSAPLNMMRCYFSFKAKITSNLFCVLFLITSACIGLLVWFASLSVKTFSFSCKSLFLSGLQWKEFYFISNIRCVLTCSLQFSYLVCIFLRPFFTIPAYFYASHILPFGQEPSRNI